MMNNDEPAVHDTVAEHAEAYDASTLAHDPVEEGDWLDEGEELPRRPRRRLLTPVPIALAALLLTACGFIGGVLVEKGQSSTSSTTAAGSSLASRFAGLRGAGTGTGTSAAGASGGGGAAGGFAGGGGGATTGQVAFIEGSTLYVTNTQGNTVKVNTSPASTVTKTVSSNVKAIHPGETVVIVGAKGANGTVSAESIRVGAGGAGGLGSLFGGSSGSSGGTGGSSGGTGSGGPALFGAGGG